MSNLFLQALYQARPYFLSVVTAALLASCALQRPGDTVVLSVVGTNDVHGQLLPAIERGGLVTLSGYVNALRSVRGSEHVVLIDAGDMWQGTLESNLSEGASVVAAYNALGYAAAALGNHEFDFGPVGEAAVPTSADDDARGALKLRATEAAFPLLSANLRDNISGDLVDWPNVLPHTVVSAGNVKVGIIGVMTANALSTTIAANTHGLQVTSLRDAVVQRARQLRQNGVNLIVVTAHAGGRCREFDDSLNLASCDLGGEIFKLAAALPHGSVDQIIAGHVHDGIAHEVNGIAITASYSRTYAFSRVDYELDSATRTVVSRTVFPPQVLCPYSRDKNGDCPWDADPDNARSALYEGRVIEPDPVVSSVVEKAREDALAIKRQPVGVTLQTPFTLAGNPESPLGNLMTTAIREMSDADVAIHNVSGGIRASLPAGQLHYGDLYEAFPFDNRLVVLETDGRALRKIVAAQVRRQSRRAGISGARILASCEQQQLTVRMLRDDGSDILDDDVLRIAVNDYLATGGDRILTPAIEPASVVIDSSAPLIRDLLQQWLNRQAPLHAADFSRAATWNIATKVDAECVLSDNS